MERIPNYPAARTVAATVEAHFTRHIADARERGEKEVAALPTADTIELIIEATFWASLRPEEGRFPKNSLAYLSPNQAQQPLLFETRLPLTPHTLIKLAPAVERPAIHLGVWHDRGELYVWGTTRAIPSHCFVIEDIEPGLLVVKHRRADAFGKYANVAVLKGEQVKVIDEKGTSLPDCPALLRALLAFTSDSSRGDSVNLLVQLAASMRAHGHGGTMLVVPPGDEWKQSIVYPVLYAVTPPYPALTDLITLGPEQRTNVWQASLRRAVDTVAGLTAVDGATIVNDHYEVLAFGTKIRRRHGSHTVDQMVLTEPIVGNQAEIVPPVQHGGTRHLSAAQFVNDQRDALVMVASQDGRFTVFAWSPCEEMVHAHSVDVLLL